MKLVFVRAKLAAMIARAEAMQAWLESVTYEMHNMVRKPLTSHPSMSSGLRVFDAPVIRRAGD